MNRDLELETLETVAHALRRNEITQDTFLRSTRGRWKRLGEKLYQRWRNGLPSFVDAEDVVQELQMQVLAYVPKWACGGTRIGAYLTWSAIHRTQRTMNKWRGASTSGNEGKNPSRYEVCFAQAFARESEEGSERDPADRAQVDADQDEWVEAAERFRDVLQGARTIREALVLLSIRRADGSVERAAELLWVDPRARVECDLRDEKHARRVVAGVFSKLSDRYQGQTVAA